MDDVIICPNCGETNPSDMPYCHNCQWRLRSLEDAWASEPATDRTPDSESSSPENEAADSVPDWLRLAPTQRRPDQADDEAAAEQLRQRLASQDPVAPPARPLQRGASEDLLAGLTHAEQPDDEPIPDWVARIMGITDGDGSDQSGAQEADPRSVFGQARDSGGTGLIPEEAEPPDTDVRFGTSLASGGRGPAGEGDSPLGDAATGAHGRESDDIYEWLRQLDANKPAPPVRTARGDVPATTDVPTWVGRMLGVTGEAATEAGGSDSSIPNWLQSTSTPEADPLSSQPRNAVAPAAPGEPSEPSPSIAPPAATVEPVDSVLTSPDIPVSRQVEETDSLDVDAVFASMQMPSWAAGSESMDLPGATAKPPAAHDDASIEPAELPSWVQAMRPVESAVAAQGIPQPASSSESGGPLRGIGGVLPAVLGAAMPYSRPKQHAMQLDVSDRHRVHARLLEDMLAAESQPLPLQRADRAGSPRALRWVIGSVLIFLLITGLASGSANFVLPVNVALESTSAIQVVQNLAPDAPVLAVFDYEPATAGEMEVAAASIMDHLLLLKHPPLVLLSTSPTGSALAERFLTTSLRERAYVRGTQYVDLGYLSGGLSGVQFFARDPAGATPVSAAMDRAWESQVLLGVRGLPDFSAIIVLTDSLESGSVWIEQTTGHRGATPMILVASAQAGPMLLPYFDSGQIQGLVVGISGAAGAETANGGRPGLVRRYWDAYNLGLYTAAFFIILGALWQLASGWRRRRAEAA